MLNDRQIEIKLWGFARRWQIAYLDGAWFRDNRFEVNCINERLAERDVLDATVVKPIHIVPDWPWRNSQ